jgi:SAM-dependent methyltransferase
MPDRATGKSPRSASHTTNALAWDAYARTQQRFARPVTDKEFSERLAAIANDHWLAGSLAGARVLCLGSGGGMQSPLYAAAGAQVTVVDISGEMLALDRRAAAERGLEVTTLEASIDDLTALDSGRFDTVIQPVSSCYVPDVVAVYREVARVIVPGGLYVSQHKQPVNLQATVKPGNLGYVIDEPYYRSGPLPPVTGSPHREAGTLEFLHRWEELLGGLCRSGFQLEDLSEPQHTRRDAVRGSFAHRSLYVAPYVRVKARRFGQRTAVQSSFV